MQCFRRCSASLIHKQRLSLPALLRCKLLHYKAMRLLLAITLLHVARAHPCDNEAMKACPFDGGKALGACLNDPSKHEEKVEISAECTDFMKLHETCAAEFAGGTCGGSAFTDDALLCLTSWMNPADVSEACAAALPAKEEAKAEEEVDEATLLKRARRKHARKKAAEQVRKLNEKNDKGAKPKKKAKKRKSSGGYGDDL